MLVNDVGEHEKPDEQVPVIRNIACSFTICTSDAFPNFYASESGVMQN